MKPQITNAFIVNDNLYAKEALSRSLNLQPSINVSGMASNGQEALIKIKRCRPDIVIVDLSRPNQDGLDLIKKIRLQDTNLPILGFSMRDENIDAERALWVGAQGYVTKGDNFIEAIKTVLDGHTYLSHFVTKKRATPSEGFFKSIQQGGR